MLCCIALCCIVLHCIILYRFSVLFCIVLLCIVLCCIGLFCIALYCIVLYCIVLCRFSVLFCIELICIVLCNLFDANFHNSEYRKTCKSKDYTPFYKNTSNFIQPQYCQETVISSLTIFLKCCYFFKSDMVSEQNRSPLNGNHTF